MCVRYWILLLLLRQEDFRSFSFFSSQLIHGMQMCHRN